MAASALRTNNCVSATAIRGGRSNSTHSKSRRRMRSNSARTTSVVSTAAGSGGGGPLVRTHRCSPTRSMVLWSPARRPFELSSLVSPPPSGNPKIRCSAGHRRSAETRSVLLQLSASAAPSRLTTVVLPSPRTALVTAKKRDRLGHAADSSALERKRYASASAGSVSVRRTRRPFASRGMRPRIGIPISALSSRPPEMLGATSSRPPTASTAMNRTAMNANNALRVGRGLLGLPGTGAGERSSRSEPALACCATMLESCCCNAVTRPVEPAAWAARILPVSRVACWASCARSAAVRTLRNVSATRFASCAEREALPSLAVMLMMFAVVSRDVVIFCCRLAADSPPNCWATGARTAVEVTYAWMVARFTCVVVEPDAALVVA